MRDNQQTNSCVEGLFWIVLLPSLKGLKADVISSGMVVKKKSNKPIDDVQLACETWDAPYDDPGTIQYAGDLQKPKDPLPMLPLFGSNDKLVEG